MTIIEVVDSAVKIGLGALIATVGGYFLNVRNHQNDLDKRNDLSTKELVKSIAVNLEEIESSYNKACHLHMEGKKGEGNSALVDATSLSYTACAQANILGSDDLVRIVTEMSEVSESLYDLFKNGNENHLEINGLSQKLQELKRQAYPFIRKLYTNDIT